MATLLQEFPLYISMLCQYFAIEMNLTAKVHEIFCSGFQPKYYNDELKEVSKDEYWISLQRYGFDKLFFSYKFGLWPIPAHLD